MTRDHTCEGCDEIAESRGLPMGWIGTGASRFPKQTIAEWCPQCVKDGTMAREAQTTRHAAIRRHQLRTQEQRP